MECLWDTTRSCRPGDRGRVRRWTSSRLAQPGRPQLLPRRATVKQGLDAGHEGKSRPPAARPEGPAARLHGHGARRWRASRSREVMSKEFLASPFWTYWRTMFAFEERHSALEFKLTCTASCTTSAGCRTSPR
ncbi:oleate hydratase [Kocuria rhizophila]|nr:oleate hydratase [Kocuria rhizophila]